MADLDALAQLQAANPDMFAADYTQEDFDDESRPVKRLKTLREKERVQRGPREAKPRKPKEPKTQEIPKMVAGFYGGATESQPATELVLPELEASEDEDDGDQFDDDDDEDGAPNMDLDDINFVEEPLPAAPCVAPISVKSEPGSPPARAQASVTASVAPSVNIKPELPSSLHGRTAHIKPETTFSPGAYRMPLASGLATTSHHAVASFSGPNTCGDALSMFWTDAREDSFGSPGTVYLFGKTLDATQRQWKSCCVRVNNINRCVYVLPRREKLDAQGMAISGAEPTLVEVVQELGDVMAKKNIPTRRMKAVDRWYAFEEEGVPKQKTKWVKVRYPASSPALNISDCSKFKTFSHIFGDNRSFLELLLLKRKMKGPSWLTIKGATRVSEGNQITWASEEYSVDTYKSVTALPDTDHRPPPLTVMSLNMLTFLNESKKVNEIAAVTCVVNREVSMDGQVNNNAVTKWTAVRRLGDNVFPFDLEKVFRSKNCEVPRKEQTEKALLTGLMNEIERTDPDMLVGHNFMGFDLDVLLHRMAANGVGNWSRIGKMRLRQMPRLQSGAGGTGESTWEERAVLNGRLVADTYLLAREYLKESSYKLLRLAITQGLEGPSGPVTETMVEEEPFLDVAKELGSSEGIYKLVHWCDTKAVLALGLMYKMQIIPLTKRLTTLAGNLWSRTLTGSRAERIEYLLLHKFHLQKFICPDKARRKWAPKQNEDDEAEVGATAARGKPKYLGGKVLEPKRGLYTDYVLLLDFNSLYPSLIQEYNLCFTTVERSEQLADGSYADCPVPTEDQLVCDSCKHLLKQQTEDGKPRLKIEKGGSCLHRCLLPKAIKELVDSRGQVKKLLKAETDPQKKAVLDIRQKALKLTANSIYGCLGFQSSRFYAQAIAQLVTSKGREALTNTVEMVPKIDQSLDVIYGDTDSVMISTGMSGDVNAAIKMANLIKKDVNKMYRCLEIDIDGIFKSILLVRKKKYAALTLKDLAKGDNPDNVKQEIKGLDLVRRDWCPLSQKMSVQVLNFILSGRPGDEILDTINTYLAEMGDSIRNGKEDLKDFIITKSLTKAPEQYADRAVQPHVQVALRMKEQNLTVQTNDLIPYIVCEATSVNPDVLGLKADWDKSKLAMRAFHHDEVKNPATGLKPDLDWYLATQIHPPITRLCEHIQGMDSHYIAETLGLQASKYLVHTSSSTSSEPMAVYRYTTHSYDMDDEQRYEDCEQLQFDCGRCKAPVVISIKQRLYEAVEKLFQENMDPSSVGPMNFFTCEQCSTVVPLPKIYNTVLLKIRQHQQKYYSQCPQISTHPSKDAPHSTYTDQMFRHQLTYYISMFDFPNARDQVYNRLERKLLAPVRKSQPALFTQKQRSLNDLFQATINKTLPSELWIEDPLERKRKLVLRGEQLQKAEQLKEDLSVLTKMIRIRLQSCRRHYVNLGDLFANMGQRRPEEDGMKAKA
uniref:DNA polymerase n=1 Tax=Eutreptiella gymnastica TaxID=73025 RepID=A0A7S1IK49_9EUGL|mmetsp:Transcript_24319/g.43941  ORF Transcript_24319/g.43941 Transcript_24319/m.43941 type:complete len:1448 (+) Transcript_24319:125-4468(+)